MWAFLPVLLLLVALFCTILLCVWVTTWRPLSCTPVVTRSWLLVQLLGLMTAVLLPTPEHRTVPLRGLRFCSVNLTFSTEGLWRVEGL